MNSMGAVQRKMEILDSWLLTAHLLKQQRGRLKIMDAGMTARILAGRASVQLPLYLFSHPFGSLRSGSRRFVPSRNHLSRHGRRSGFVVYPLSRRYRAISRSR
ncbi:hypothetical protein VPH35_104667 [Triticum aestivum]